MINLATRHGLPHETKARIFFREFGHLQTFPLLAVFVVLLRRQRRIGRRHLLLDVIAMQGFWELVTEAYGIVRTGRTYLAAWRPTRNPAVLLFWPLMSFLALLPFLAEASRAGAAATISPGPKRPARSRRAPSECSCRLDFPVGWKA